jgi:hypothetical protein
MIPLWRWDRGGEERTLGQGFEERKGLRDGEVEGSRGMAVFLLLFVKEKKGSVLENE